MFYKRQGHLLLVNVSRVRAWHKVNVWSWRLTLILGLKIASHILHVRFCRFDSDIIGFPSTFLRNQSGVEIWSRSNHPFVIYIIFFSTKGEMNTGFPHASLVIWFTTSSFPPFFFHWMWFLPSRWKITCWKKWLMPIHHLLSFFSYSLIIRILSPFTCYYFFISRFSVTKKSKSKLFLVFYA